MRRRRIGELKRPRRRRHGRARHRGRTSYPWTVRLAGRAKRSSISTSRCDTVHQIRHEVAAVANEIETGGHLWSFERSRSNASRSSTRAARALDRGADPRAWSSPAKRTSARRCSPTGCSATTCTRSETFTATARSDGDAVAARPRLGGVGALEPRPKLLLPVGLGHRDPRRRLAALPRLGHQARRASRASTSASQPWSPTG